MNFPRSLAAVAVLICFVGVAGKALAESAVDRSVYAVVAIHPMIALSCTSVNLGVWRVPPRTTGGITRVMLDIDKEALGPQIFFNQKIARAQAYADWEPEFGVCTLTNSRALDQASAVIKISNNRLLKVTPDDVAFTKVKGGRAGYGIRVDVYAPTLVKIINGEATFKVGGGMTIPERLQETDYGAYRTTVRPIISIDDRMR
jgi:hypothetical protein